MFVKLMTGLEIWYIISLFLCEAKSFISAKLVDISFSGALCLGIRIVLIRGFVLNE